MIDEDNEGFGLNSFNENFKIDDPAATNAINSSVH